MYIKGFLLVSAFIINLGSTSELCTDRLEIDANATTTSTLLNAYYLEFNQSPSASDNCKCNLDLAHKPVTLTNYYSEFLK